MQFVRNPLGQPVGVPVAAWRPARRPARERLPGRLCRLEPLDAALHAAGLQAAFAADRDGRNWTYLADEPFAGETAWRRWAEARAGVADPFFYAIVDAGTGVATGVAAYLRIAPETGSVEVGHLNFSPRLQRTAAATEAMYLMMANAFALGYRRYEWKCDSLNAPSRAAAQRLGLSFEGIFRQALVVKGRNRDTAWYAAIDTEWPALHDAFERWLDPANFGEDGRQRRRLAEFTAPILKARG